MLCRKNLSCDEDKRGSVPVYLNVYDLTPINGYAYWFGLGVYHSGVQGIFEGEPKQCEGFTFRKTILIGKTDMGSADVRALMEDLAAEYKGNAYNLITKNCNHFCNDACIKLTGNPIPNWVNRLARIGFLCNCVLPANLNSTKVRHHRIEDKVEETEKRKLTSGSNRFTSSSNSSSSSSSSPSRNQIRGRSRSRRRALAPSSPLISSPP
ncbi:deSI-like protein At4g17486 isoform X2 [Jatropha curcas]|uniref:deSI-like protein At4g17486 isoform X2 n=1 Tax=Jatropha curcas TaxID=180498 RepID=UPI0005FC10C0|nr:deSI-like protein At4g17486 isoform X2 [Jatropha curcas]